MSTKPCSACLQELPLSAYSEFQFKKKKDRRCKECIVAASREKRKRVKENVPVVKKSRTKPGGGPVEMFGYDTLTVEELLQNIFEQVQDNKVSTRIDWSKIAAAQTHCVMTPRECQLLWRHLAYKKDDITTDVKAFHKLQAETEIEADDSDIDAPFKPENCFLPPVPVQEVKGEKQSNEPETTSESTSVPPPIVVESSQTTSPLSNQDVTISSNQNPSTPENSSASPISQDIPFPSQDMPSFAQESSMLSSGVTPFRSNSSPFFSVAFPPNSAATLSPINSPGSWSNAFALPAASLSSLPASENSVLSQSLASSSSLPPALAASAMSPSLYSLPSPWARGQSSSATNQIDSQYNSQLGSQNHYSTLPSFSTGLPFSSVSDTIDRSPFSFSSS